MITSDQHYRNTLDAVRTFETALAHVDEFTAGMDALARSCFVDAYTGQLAELRALAADYEARLSTATPPSRGDSA
jgi:hypothetical protein